jgi:hypothetical protein
MPIMTRLLPDVFRNPTIRVSMLAIFAFGFARRGNLALSIRSRHHASLASAMGFIQR